MRSSSMTLLVSVLIAAGVGCASAPQADDHDDAWLQRRQLELDRVAANVAFECVDSPAVSYLMLFYTPWDREEYQPLRMPALEEDFLRAVVEGTGRFSAYPELQTALVDEVNGLLNKELDRIAAGDYNAIYVRIDDKLDIGVAPAGESSLHVWIPEERSEPGEEAEAADSAEEGSPPEELWVVSTAGEVLEHYRANATEKLAQEAPYQTTWKPRSETVRFWDRPDEDADSGPRGWNARWGSPGFWTYAAWPPQLTAQQIRRCRGAEHDTIRH